MALISFENIVFPDDHFMAVFANKPKIILLIFQLGLVVVIQDDDIRHTMEIRVSMPLFGVVDISWTKSGT